MFLFAIFFFSGTPPLFGGNSESEQIWSITDFGEDGARVPSFLGSGPSPAFFDFDFSSALEKRIDYTAFLDLKDWFGNPGTWGDAIISLANQSDVGASITVSAQDGGTIQNFLIPLPPWGYIDVDITHVIDFRNLYFVSMQPFEGAIHFPGKGSRHDYGFSSVTPINSRYELDFTDSYESALLCGPRYTVRLRVAANPEIFYEDAYFERVEVGRGTCSELTGTVPIQNLNVYWPSDDILHHSGDGHDEVSCLTEISKCVKLQYATTSLANGNILSWLSRDWVLGQGGGTIRDTFDDVLFNSACGMAFCQTPGGGSGSGDICSVNPDFVWYIYKPGVSSCDFYP